ncbi:MAG: transposase [Deltaproteobacteria bacterium]
MKAVIVSYNFHTLRHLTEKFAEVRRIEANGWSEVDYKALEGTRHIRLKNFCA